LTVTAHPLGSSLNSAAAVMPSRRSVSAAPCLPADREPSHSLQRLHRSTSGHGRAGSPQQAAGWRAGKDEWVTAPAGFVMVVLCLPLAAAAGWAGRRIGVPYPVLLVVAGVLVGLLPWVHLPALAPGVVFFLFLPPLIYYAAYFISPADLRANARPIGLLAVGLVVVTMAAVAGVLVVLVPALPWGVAAVAGAVVAPTDPVAATSVFRRLGAPERLVTIVEGEGLINDGAALVLYAGAVAATVAGTLHPGGLVWTLVAAPLGGTALGLGVAWLVVAVRRRLDEPLVEITISLATPYLIYVLAQSLGLSGILATVAAGVFVGSRTGSIYRAGARLQAFAFLDVLVFLLNAVLFTLVGVQVVQVVHRVPGLSTPRVIGILAAVVVVVVGARLVWMLAGTVTAGVVGRRNAPVLRERTVVGWAGMRGGVSLAAALAVPLRLANGAPVPYRNLVILTAAAVILATLVGQGMTLPWLLRRLDVNGDDHHDDERLARLHAARAALARLDELAAAPGESATADGALAQLRGLYAARVTRLAVDPVATAAASEQPDQTQHYRPLRLELLGIERSVVTTLRAQGRLSANGLRAVERGLDLEETRLRDL
jgi:Na+/H+ antiporter